MALLTQKEFAELCGVDKAKVSMAKKRNQIVMSGDFIDPNIEKNRLVIEKWKLKSLGEDVPKTEIKFKKLEVRKKDVKPFEAVFPNYSGSRDEDEDDDLSDDEREIKEATNKIGYAQVEITKKIKETERIMLQSDKLRIEIDKLHGILIPTELVKIVLAQYTQAVSTSFKNGGESLLIEITKRANLNRNEQAELRGQLIAIINESVANAVQAAKKGIQNIVNEYSEKK